MIIKKLITFTLITLLLSSCSYKSVVISNLDYLITNRVDKNLSLYYREKDFLQRDIQIYLEEIKPIVRELREKVSLIDLNTVDVKETLQFFNNQYYSLAALFNPILAKYISNFDNNKREKFINNLEKKNKELIEKVMNRELKNYVKRYEYFFNKLREDQLRNIETHLSTIQMMSEKRIEARLSTERSLKLILKKENKEYRNKEILKLFNTVSDRRVMSKGLTAYSQKLQSFLKGISEEQKTFFNKKKTEVIVWLDLYLKTNFK